MLNSMNSKQEEQSTTSMNAEYNLNEDSLMNRYQVKESPFWIWEDRRGEKPKYYGTLGDFKVTEDFENYNDAETPIRERHWNFMISVIVAVIQKTEDVKRIAKEIPQG